jgi:hypothetical protein
MFEDERRCPGTNIVEAQRQIVEFEEIPKNKECGGSRK